MNSKATLPLSKLRSCSMNTASSLSNSLQIDSRKYRQASSDYSSKENESQDLSYHLSSVIQKVQDNLSSDSNLAVSKTALLLRLITQFEGNNASYVDDLESFYRCSSKDLSLG